MKQQTTDETGIAVHFRNSITNHLYRRKVYTFLPPGFAILQDRATRDHKIESYNVRFEAFIELMIKIKILKI